MNGPKRGPEDRSLFHILLGEPDDDCEICRAHGLTGHDIPPGATGIVIPGVLDEILRCPCPLCAQLSFEDLDGRGAPEDPSDN